MHTVREIGLLIAGLETANAWLKAFPRKGTTRSIAVAVGVGLVGIEVVIGKGILQRAARMVDDAGRVNLVFGARPGCREEARTESVPQVVYAAMVSLFLPLLGQIVCWAYTGTNGGRIRRQTPSCSWQDNLHNS